MSEVDLHRGDADGLGQTGPRPLIQRAPFRAWLVTGPVGRLVGFLIDFARALRAHLAARRRG